MQWQRKLGLVLYGLYGIVGAVIAMNLDEWLGRDLSRLQTLLAVAVGLSPEIVFQIFIPSAFAVRASGNSSQVTDKPNLVELQPTEPQR